MTEEEIIIVHETAGEDEKLQELIWEMKLALKHLHKVSAGLLVGTPEFQALSESKLGLYTSLGMLKSKCGYKDWMDQEWENKKTCR